ncbi:MAG: HAD-IC family P-type ATPase [Oscillospiraceae bacterium]|nr:HAD-IC family P-type ATPase [Oscillospiraceae bacterium]
MAGKIEPVQLNKVLSRVEVSADRGLTLEQARERLKNGYANIRPESAEKTVGQILRNNVFTYFNLVFTLLALCVVLVRSYRDLMFLPVIVINCVIGVIQELRSRRALAQLSFIAAPNAVVIRDREKITVPVNETVLDDIAVFTTGMQIYADAIVVSGECQVNEALVTGESDEITKSPGDTLLSGSFVVSGECCARLDKVGRDSFVAQLTLEAKKTRQKGRVSMMASLKRLVQVIGVIIIPVGITLFLQQLRAEHTIADATVRTVAILIGMIPDGLYLLVSVALTISVMRLARSRTLVHERGCVEMLARVDVLCVDKTGTITEKHMEVKDTALLCADRYNADDVDMILTDYIANSPDDNETMTAMREYFKAKPKRRARKTLPFSSANKYGGVSFHEDESYLLGAPEKILLDEYGKYKDEIEKYSSQGYRVLLLAHYDGDIAQKVVSSRALPLALILLANRVRPEAPAAFRFFAKQGVKIIVISGDNPVTVSQVAREAGIEGAELFVDAAELTTDRKIKRAVSEYVVFGRVTPDQKRRLVRALKGAGHTVAMTGDGVNDVLALKDADCSIAMASGSEVASQVSDIVLLDSNFAAMPAVVMEGRRVINNIERSASLFLVRNIFSLLLALVSISFALELALTPAQLSLFSATLIGVPSFVLAMEPNKNLVRGKFLKNVITNALPAGLTDFAALTVLIVISTRLDIPVEEISTMAVIIVAFVGFQMLYKISRPLNALRIALIVTMFVGFTLGAIVLRDVFGFSALSGQSIWLTIIFCVATVPLMLFLSLIFRNRKK